MCNTDNDCPFLYHCSQNLKCQHDEVFPLQFYTIFIYILLPFLCSICNVTGSSMGKFKVLIVMFMLGYRGQQATMITQAMVVGSALPNYIQILIRKHPERIGSLVNFNLVMILIPSCLLGSTLGALVVNYVPELVQDVLVVIVAFFFAVKFYKKFKEIKKKQENIKHKTKIDSLISNNENNCNNQSQVNDIYSEQKKSLIQGGQQIKTSTIHQNQENIDNLRISLLSNHKDQLELEPQLFIQRQNLLKQQQSYHFKQVLFSILVFLIFQVLVFTVQGQFSFLKFTHCDIKYYLGIVILIIVTLTYLKVIKIFMKKKFSEYQRLKYHQQINLKNNRTFLWISFGGFMGGFIQGIIGLGSGTCIMTVLLQFSVNPSSATATSGYQILFIGLAALFQGYINNHVKIADTVFFLLVCSILGGLATYGFNQYLKNKNQIKVSKILLCLLSSLCILSVIMVFPSAYISIRDFGWDKFIAINNPC